MGGPTPPPAPPLSRKANRVHPPNQLPAQTPLQEQEPIYMYHALFDKRAKPRLAKVLNRIKKAATKNSKHAIGIKQSVGRWRAIFQKKEQMQAPVAHNTHCSVKWIQAQAKQLPLFSLALCPTQSALCMLTLHHSNPTIPLPQKHRHVPHPRSRQD